MAGPVTPITRQRKFLRKSITFAAGAGSGDIGTVAAVTTTGTVWIEGLNIHCTTTLVGATGTISLGISGDASVLIPITLASLITTGTNWFDPNPQKVGECLTNITLSDNLIFTIATAGLTAGVVEIEIVYDSLSTGAALG